MTSFSDKHSDDDPRSTLTRKERASRGGVPSLSPRTRDLSSAYIGQQSTPPSQFCKRESCIPAVPHGMASNKMAMRTLGRCAPLIRAQRLTLRPFSSASASHEKQQPPRVVLNDADITENFLRGTGPGGQKIVRLPPPQLSRSPGTRFLTFFAPNRTKHPARSSSSTRRRASSLNARNPARVP